MGLTIPSSTFPALAFTVHLLHALFAENVPGTRDQAMARDNDRVAKLDGEMAEEAAYEEGRGRERGLVWSPALKVWGGRRCWWAGQTARLEKVA